MLSSGMVLTALSAGWQHRVTHNPPVLPFTLRPKTAVNVRPSLPVPTDWPNLFESQGSWPPPFKDPNLSGPILSHDWQMIGHFRRPNRSITWNEPWLRSIGMLRQWGWRYKSIFKRPFFWDKSSAPDTGIGEVFAQHEFYSNT